MNSQLTEPTASGLHGLKRSVGWWLFGMLAMVIVNIAFWPSIEGTNAFKDLEQSAGELLRAFGAYELSTPAGYLDAQLYALVLPLLFSGTAISAMSLITAGDEDTGRLELLHAMPISRQALWLGRFGALVIAMVFCTLAVSAITGLSIVVFSLDGIGTIDIIAVTGGCALLGLLHGAIAFAVGGLGGSRARAVEVAVSVLIIGYILNFVFPLSATLAKFSHISPWHWTLGEQPLTRGINWQEMPIVIALITVLVVAGTVAVTRRDIRGS